MRPFLLLGLFLAAFLLGPCLFGETAGQYDWQPVPDDPNYMALLDMTRPVGQRQIGCINVRTCEYSRYDRATDMWRKCRCPAPLPSACMLTGVDVGKLGDECKITDGNGRRIERDQLDAALNVKRINVIGSGDGVAAAFAAAKKYGDNFVVTTYSPQAWQIVRQGFVVPANPTIYIQDPKGGVIRRLDGWAGEQAFDSVIKEVLGHQVKPNPNYDSKKDKGWDGSSTSTSTGFPWIPASVVTLMAIYAVASYRRKA